jgi:hypothetical protein
MIMKRPRPRMNRLLLLLLAYAVGGAIINVAVAWGCTLCINPWKGVWLRAQRSAPANTRPIDPEYVSLTVVRASRSGATDIEITWHRSTFFPYVDESPLSLVPAWTGLQEPSAPLLVAEFTIVEIRGWPVTALWTSHTNTFPTGSLQTRHGLRTAWTRRIPLINGAKYKVALPLQPIWPGFAINTLFYAGVLWVMCAVSLALRRMIRRRRGQCPACAYPIGSSTVCTECGRPVTARIMS